MFVFTLDRMQCAKLEWCSGTRSQFDLDFCCAHQHHCLKHNHIYILCIRRTRVTFYNVMLCSLCVRHVCMCVIMLHRKRKATTTTIVMVEMCGVFRDRVLSPRHLCCELINLCAHSVCVLRRLYCVHQKLTLAHMPQLNVYVEHFGIYTRITKKAITCQM